MTRAELIHETIGGSGPWVDMGGSGVVAAAAAADDGDGEDVNGGDDDGGIGPGGAPFSLPEGEEVEVEEELLPAAEVETGGGGRGAHIPLSKQPLLMGGSGGCC